MALLLLSNTTSNIQIGDISGNNVKTNVRSPQGDAISGIFFNIALGNSLRSIKEEMNKRKPDVGHSYSKKLLLPKGLIFADHSHFPTEGESEKEQLKNIMKDYLKDIT